MNWFPISYGDFYDFPRLILIEKEATRLLLECSFDEAGDDYDDYYSVYTIDLPAKSVLWSDMKSYIVKKVGEIPVRSVQFDQTKRQLIASAELDGMIEALTAAPCPSPPSGPL